MYFIEAKLSSFFGCMPPSFAWSQKKGIQIIYKMYLENSTLKRIFKTTPSITHLCLELAN